MILDIASLAGVFTLKQTPYSLSTTQVTQAALQDPTRWGIIFCVGGSGGNAFVSLDSNPLSTNGMVLALNSVTIIYFNQMGGLTQAAFYAKASAVGCTLTVIEVFLRPAG